MSYFASRAERAVTCILYLLLGILTGLFSMALGAMWRGPVPPTWYVGLLGSLFVASAAATALFRFQGTGYIALAGGIMLLIFYIPFSLSDYATPMWSAGKLLPVILMFIDP